MTERTASRSIAHRINGERLVLAGWSRAILLQMAHPLIAAGVAEHSTFRGGPTAAAGRLHGTVRAMLGLTFGSHGDRQRVVAHILSIHRRVHGELKHTVGLFPAGTRYSAEDPALVLWVHATLLESTTLAYQAIVGQVSGQEFDQYCVEAADAAIALGAEPQLVPRSKTALERYMQSVYDSQVLGVGRDATDIAEAVLGGPLAALAFPAGWMNRLVTTAWLPEDLRRAYGLQWNDRRARHASRALAFLRASRRVMPDVLARWPQARGG